MSSPLVSVILPTFNRKRVLSEAIESVLSQTYQKFELLIVDDGSTDGTQEAIQKYLRDTRIHYQYQENRGVSAARNLALRNSRGDLIAFIDSDNLWERYKLEFQVRIFKENPEVNILYNDGFLVDEEGKVLSGPSGKKHSGVITRELLIDNFITANSVIFRRNCYMDCGGFDEELQSAVDYDLWLRLSIKYEFTYVPLIVYRYRLGRGRLTSDRRAKLLNICRVLSMFVNNNFDDLPLDVSRIALCQGYCFLSKLQNFVGDEPGPVASILRAICMVPNWRPAWRLLFQNLRSAISR